MRHLKPLLIVCLCLTMLVSSVTGAFARGQMAFGQTLQICAEGEPASIMLDARGNPLRAMHSCPDCVAVAAGLPPAALDMAQPLGRWVQLAVPCGAGVASQTALHAFARGPPVLI
jgi:hypothetical protein